MEIMDHRGFVQVSELCHIVCLIKFGRIHFVDSLRIDLSLLLHCKLSLQLPWNCKVSYTVVVTLHKQIASMKLLDYPSLHEC